MKCKCDIIIYLCEMREERIVLGSDDGVVEWKEKNEKCKTKKQRKERKKNQGFWEKRKKKEMVTELKWKEISSSQKIRFWQKS